MMSFDSRESSDKSEGLPSSQFGSRGWPLIHMIILKAIGGLSYKQLWVHSRSSSYSHVRRNGLIKVYRLLFLWEALGLIYGIGSFSKRQCWAHPRSSEKRFKSHTGPFQGHWQLLLSVALSSFEPIGSFSCDKILNHSGPSAFSPVSNTGPI